MFNLSGIPKIAMFWLLFFFFLLPTPLFSTAEDDLPTYFVPPPPFSEGIYPCSNCHRYMKPNPTRRELTFHQNIKLKNHAEKQRWCLDCHDLNDRDKLRLASGKKISFEESYYLCGQCHGPQFRKWKYGNHGKRTGYWNGKKLYRLCAHCHNPHQPRFKPLKPLPPPVKPQHIVYKSEKLKKETYKRVVLPELMFVPEEIKKEGENAGK
ncbi:MAG: hypothetical protein D6828_00610 [Nitrospirae bacterium]|nr:MAG: hypothetical protein D6828_00610 [Nitrospirota bacterium]